MKELCSGDQAKPIIATKVKPTDDYLSIRVYLTAREELIDEISRFPNASKIVIKQSMKHTLSTSNIRLLIQLSISDASIID